MEFLHEKKDYNVAEFQEKCSLPQIVMVTQGYCGEYNENTFDREQVCLFSLGNEIIIKQGWFVQACLL
jgi:hypothetical protein